MRRKVKMWMTTMLILIALVILFGKSALGVFSLQEQHKARVVLDAGHGGPDPGKVGINGALEKDINLEIASYVKTYLEQNGIEVVMTRESDRHLCQSESSFRKVEDLKNRLAIIETSNPQLVVSIHQNSYLSESANGPQVFYFKDSEEGLEAAGLMQAQLNKELAPIKSRVEKANDSYFLLKKSPIPTIIVECGFLSNRQEADLLLLQEYQKKVAWNISIGIMQYLSNAKWLEN